MSTTALPVPTFGGDFYRWTQRQAAELRRAAETGSNLPLDWLRLAEEIESLGERDRRELYSRLVRAIEHLVKLQFGPAQDPRRVWEISVLNQRRDLRLLLQSSPSLKRTARSYLEQAHLEALELVVRGIPDAEQDQWPDLPRTCPYTLDQILDGKWWPERPAS